jgi:hypothetical protein
MDIHSSRYFYRLAATALVLVLATLGSGVSPTRSQSQLPSNLSEARFGAVESYLRPVDAVEAEVGWERIIFEWRYLQPNGPDDWDTSHIPDEWLDNARRAGRLIVGLVKNAPHWATGSDLLGAPALGLDLPIDDPSNVWAAFIKKLVSYYGEKWNIHHWIIYNEPDIRPENTSQFEFAGTVEDYYQTVKVAYKAAHATDPQVVIHLAGFTYWHDVVYQREFYLARFLKLAYADPEARENNLFFDVVTVHAYYGTDAVWSITRLARSLPRSFGYPKPVWINEFNARVTVDHGWPLGGGKPTVTLGEQASFIIQGAALALAAGAERAAVYKFYDNDVTENYEAWGLIRADGTRRPGFYALQTANRYFNGTIKAQRYTSPSAVLVTLEQPDKTVYVVWNRTTEPVYARIKAADRTATDSIVVSVAGLVQAAPPGEHADGSYELLLPPCTAPCAIQGEPRILVQRGTPKTVWILKGEDAVKIN